MKRVPEARIFSIGRFQMTTNMNMPPTVSAAQGSFNTNNFGAAGDHAIGQGNAGAG